MLPQPQPAVASRLVSINLDEASIGSLSAEVDHERKVAIFDLIEENFFELVDGPPGPYKLAIAIVDGRLAFSVKAGNDPEPSSTFLLSLTPFRKIVKDYFIICESYFEAIKSAPATKIEAIDMARRALHDDGSALVIERLEGKVHMDKPTSRRLFTLLCTLLWKG